MIHSLLPRTLLLICGSFVALHSEGNGSSQLWQTEQGKMVLQQRSWPLLRQNVEQSRRCSNGASFRCLQNGTIDFNGLPATRSEGLSAICSIVTNKTFCSSGWIQLDGCDGCIPYNVCSSLRKSAEANTTTELVGAMIGYRRHTAADYRSDVEQLIEACEGEIVYKSRSSIFNASAVIVPKHLLNLLAANSCLEDVEEDPLTIIWSVANNINNISQTIRTEDSSHSIQPDSDYFLVIFKPDLCASNKTDFEYQVIGHLNGTIIHRYHFVEGTAVRLPAGNAEQLRMLTQVEKVFDAIRKR